MQQCGNIKIIGRYSYYTGRCLGQGSFGKVFEGFENDTREKVAIKQIDVKILQKDAYLQGSIESQIRILSKFKHVNIVQLYQVLTSKRSLYIITEYCKHGDLRRYIKQRGSISEAESYQILKQIACGFKQLVKQKVIHRDLKPANILINEGLYKICDFGFAKYVHNMTDALKSCVGSPIYMAPQILQKQQYSYKCDLWSLGIIYYELLHGFVPWKGVSQTDLMNNIRTIPLKFHGQFSPEVQKFIRGLLTYSESERLTWEQAFLFFGVVNVPPPPVMSGNFQTLTNQQQKQLQQLQKQQGQQVILEQQREQERLMKFQQQQQYQKNATEKQQLVHQQQLNQLQNGMFINPNNVNGNKQDRRKTPETKLKFLTRHHFEQLALRHFVAMDIKTKVYKLRKYNFSKFIFQKIILLLSYSIKTKYDQFRGDVQKIHDPDSLAKIRKDQKSYNQFFEDLLEWLQHQNFLVDIRKEADMKRIVQKQVIGDLSNKYDQLLVELIQAAKKEITEFIPETQDSKQRNCLVGVFQNLCMVTDGNEQFNQSYQINLIELIKARNDIGVKTISRMSTTKQDKGAKYNSNLHFFS